MPGAVGAFRRPALPQVGGVSADTLAEDTDLTIALGRAGWRVVYEPTARAWTEAPATFGQLWRQRYRWSYGIMQSLWKHRHAVVERGAFGHIGRVGLRLTGLFQIVLPLLAPMVDIYLVYGLVFLDPVVTAVSWGGVLFVQLLRVRSRSGWSGEPVRALWLLPAAADGLPAAHVRGAHPVARDRGAGNALRWQKIPRAGDFSAVPTTAVRVMTTPAGVSHRALARRWRLAARGLRAAPTRAARRRPPVRAPAAPARGAADPAAPQRASSSVEVTFYAAPDNDPPGSTEIAYPNSRHPTAGGTGTAADPLSLATDPREIRPGVLIYYPPIRSTSSWRTTALSASSSGTRTATPTSTCGWPTPGIPPCLACEEALTPDDQDTIIVNPPTNLPVDPKPLFANGKCWPGT